MQKFLHIRVTDRAVRSEELQFGKSSTAGEETQDRGLQAASAKLSHFKSFVVAAAHLPAVQRRGRARDRERPIRLGALPPPR